MLQKLELRSAQWIELLLFCSQKGLWTVRQFWKWVDSFTRRLGRHSECLGGKGS